MNDGKKCRQAKYDGLDAFTEAFATIGNRVIGDSVPQQGMETGVIWH